MFDGKDDGTVVNNMPIASMYYGLLPLLLYESDDLNNVLGYRFLQVSGAKNSPRSGMNFFGFNLSWIGDDKYAIQILLCPNENIMAGESVAPPRIYIRSKINTIWGSWHVVKATLLS